MSRLKQHLTREAVAAAGSPEPANYCFPAPANRHGRAFSRLARRFSTEIAYPDKPFPHVDADARGVRCASSRVRFKQAANRMRRFESFVKQDTARVATEKRRQREEKTHNLKASSLSFGLDAAITEEIKQLDPILIQAIQDFEKGIEARKVWVLGAVETRLEHTSVACR